MMSEQVLQESVSSKGKCPVMSLVHGLGLSLVAWCSVHLRFRENEKLEISQLGASSPEGDLSPVPS